MIQGVIVFHVAFETMFRTELWLNGRLMGC